MRLDRWARYVEYIGEREELYFEEFMFRSRIVVAAYEEGWMDK